MRVGANHSRQSREGRQPKVQAMAFPAGFAAPRHDPVLRVQQIMDSGFLEIGSFQPFSTLAQATPRVLHLRLFMLASSPLWFAYAALCGSQGGMAYEILNSLSNLIGLYRYHLKPRHPNSRSAKDGRPA